MIVIMPVMDSHEWTARTVRSLAETVRGDDFTLIVWDNGSDEPYQAGEFGTTPFPTYIARRDINMGYYAPLFALTERGGGDELVGLMHNDLLVHEVGWNQRLGQAFEGDPGLGLVGFVGSYEVDENGGRGAGTMCHFRERDDNGNLIGQPQTAGELVYDLRPSLVLDSLFMLFRRVATEVLLSDVHDLPLAHFYDKIWALRLVRSGWKVGTLGVEVSHWGGITCVLNHRYIDDCKRWCWERGVREVPADDWHLQMYRETERRLFAEFKVPGGLVPSVIDTSWRVTHGAR